MTARPKDWSPLCGADPVPGDWEDVQALGKDIRNVANEIKEQADKLRNLCTDGYWDSDAGEKFDETAQDTAKALSKAYARYDAAADALEYYYPKLREEQAESLLVLADAKALENDRASAQDRLDADDATEADPEAPERPGRADDQAAVGAFFGKMNALRDKVEGCASRVRTAANNAASHIEDVIDDDGLKDSRLDKIRDWVSENLAPVLKVIADLAGKIAAIAGLLALAVGWIPVIGQALAAVLGTIALVAGVISLVCNLVLWFSGDGGFGAVLLDMVGVLTFGVGRAAIAGLKGGVAALNATGKLASAATKISAQVAARGGRMTDAVVDAVAKGDLRLASQLSGLRMSSLKGMLGSKFGDLSADFGAGGFRHLKGVLDEAPGGGLQIPKIKDFDYPAGLREGADGFKDLFKGQNWGDMVSQIRAGNLHPGAIDPGVVADIKNAQNLTNSLNHLPSVDAISDSIRGLQLQFNVATGIGATNDFLGNFTPALDPVKDLGTWK